MCVFCLHSFTISRNLLIFRKFRVKANRFFAFTRSPIPYSLSGIGTWGRTEFAFTDRLLIISILNRKVKAVKEKNTNYNSVRACARGKIRRKSDACRGGKPAATSRVAAKTISEINSPGSEIEKTTSEVDAFHPENEDSGKVRYFPQKNISIRRGESNFPPLRMLNDVPQDGPSRLCVRAGRQNRAD